MVEGHGRARAVRGSLVALGLALAAGCGGERSAPAPGDAPADETVADGADRVLSPLPAPAPDPAHEEIPGRGPCTDLEGVRALPPAPPASPADEVGRLARFWAIDRFLLDEGGPVYVRPRYEARLLAKARPDECFHGVGEEYGTPDVSGACATGQPKVNDSYVWGLTLAGGKLFFGTLANTLCGVEGGYLEIEEPQLFEEFVCEFGASAKGSDGRAPNMFLYDLAEERLVSLNPDPLTDPDADALRRATGGLRSAGSLGGVAFLAGTGRGGGINMFAFDAATGLLLGEPTTIGGPACLSATEPTPTCPAVRTLLNNVRQWAAAEGHLYLGVGTYRRGATADDPPVRAGAVLRWTGDAAEPYRFAEVGRLPADAANMIAHVDRRLYVTTWPSRAKGDSTLGPDGKVLGVPAGLYRSPVIPAGGLTPAHAAHADWTTPLWLATGDGDPAHADVPTYDPDRLAGLHTGGGALVSYGTDVYFGTMTVPMYGTQDAVETYATPPGEFLRTALGAHRPLSLFEVKLVGHGRPKVSMVVGEKYLPVYDAAAGGYRIRYDRAHRTGFQPRWGPSGFGNFFNTYTWTMKVFDGQVFVGTMDWAQLARIYVQGLPEGGGAPATPPEALLRALGTGFPREGADLVRFTRDGMVAESVDGCGNDRNYGVRNMVTDGESALYLGTANPMNLDPRGGWELLELR